MFRQTRFTQNFQFGKNLSFVYDDFSTGGKRGKNKTLMFKSGRGLYSTLWPRVSQIKLHENVLGLLHDLKASKT